MTKKTTPSTGTTSQSARPSRHEEPAKTTIDTSTPTPDVAPPVQAATAAEGRTTKETPSRAPAEDAKKGGAVQIVTRFPAELGARLDRYTESLRNERFGLRVSRADAVRILVHEALSAHEAKEATRAATRSS